jgi:hypothetical protein
MTTTQGYINTITAIAVHPPDLNPVFGDGVVTAQLDDEAGGPFVVLEQDGQKVRICFEEVEALVQAISQLRAQPAVQQALEEQP